jgi:hypothetical protein
LKISAAPPLHGEVSNLQENNGTKADNPNGTKADNTNGTKAENHNGTKANNPNGTKANKNQLSYSQEWSVEPEVQLATALLHPMLARWFE